MTDLHASEMRCSCGIRHRMEVACGSDEAGILSAWLLRGAVSTAEDRCGAGEEITHEGFLECVLLIKFVEVD